MLPAQPGSSGLWGEEAPPYPKLHCPTHTPSHRETRFGGKCHPSQAQGNGNVPLLQLQPSLGSAPALRSITSWCAGSREQREAAAAGCSWLAVALLGAARAALGMRNVVGQLFPWCRQPGSAALPQRPGRPPRRFLW